MAELINLLNMDPGFVCVVAMNSSHFLLPERVKVVLEACRSVRYEGDSSWTLVRPLAA